jgi:hypothetical protein
MGWTNSHLHFFEINKNYYESKDNEFFEIDDSNDSLDASEYKIKDLLGINTKCIYIYDFGDNWEHKIKVEKILEEDSRKKPFCVKLVGNCPPEDCGGIWGYYRNLEILSDPKNPEYEEVKDWMGTEYNEEMTLEDINQLLIKI